VLISSGGSRQATAPARTEKRQWLQLGARAGKSDQRLRRKGVRKRFGALDFWDRLRTHFRAWWLWMGIAALFLETDIWLGALFAGCVAFLFFHTSPHSHPAAYPLKTDLAINSDEFRVTMAGMTGMPLVSGNDVEIYNDGDEFYPAMLHAIECSEHSVTMEQHLFWGGQVGRRFAQAFAKAAQRGISVKLLVDAVGSVTLGAEIIAILRKADANSPGLAHSLVHTRPSQPLHRSEISDCPWAYRLQRRCRNR